jgi:hypothetical protein
MIAALFVEKDGCYFGLPDIDPWDKSRDARKYSGPYRVIAHPPCERWGRYATGGPNPRAKRRLIGDDGGCFASALSSVRSFGGVLEHPASSKAWDRFGISRPPRSGGWIKAGDGIGWTCHVEQGNYGHPAKKATWLYFVGPRVPCDLKWGPSAATTRLDEGWHSTEERRIARQNGIAPIKRLTTKEKIATPAPFRDLLIQIVTERNA